MLINTRDKIESEVEDIRDEVYSDLSEFPLKPRRGVLISSTIYCEVYNKLQRRVGRALDNYPRIKYIR